MTALGIRAPFLLHVQPYEDATAAIWTQTVQAGSMKNLFVDDVVLSLDAKDGMKAALMEALQQPDLLAVQDPGFRTIHQGRPHRNSVYLDFC